MELIKKDEQIKTLQNQLDEEKIKIESVNESKADYNISFVSQKDKLMKSKLKQKDEIIKQHYEEAEQMRATIKELETNLSELKKQLKELTSSKSNNFKGGRNSNDTNSEKL